MSRQPTASPPEGSDPHTSNLPAMATARVLVVDDNPLILDVVRGVLGAAHYDVVTSSGGEAAWKLLQNRAVDVIICDVMMPCMSGYELYDKLRTDPQRMHIPFIFLTALDDRKEIEHGKELGADDYLCKPFEPQELLSVVKGKLTRAQALKEADRRRFEAYQRKVLHILSHEFRTPLVAVNAGVELLMAHRDVLDGEKAQHLLRAVKRGGERLERLVNDFMILQQTEAGVAQKMFDTRAQLLPLGGVVAEQVRLKSESYRELGAQVVCTDRSERATVRGVETQLRDCVDRLISNAIKFSPADSTVEVEVHLRSGEVWVSVADRGMGLELEQLHEAIELFGQINRDKLEQQGSGLGLPIAQRFAKINGGRLEFTRREGGGTVASLVLPRAS